ncbi:MAG: hypothetical protein EA425_07545 [Puniceicoccaceae bacterium]|nr:MAG: hypothetical protein EA425_07545 [Puniceicoccaceae bacterium]
MSPRSLRFLVTPVLLLALTAAGCAANEPPPPGGTALWDGSSLPNITVSGSAHGSGEVVALEGEPFAEALRITTRSQPATNWGLEAGAHVPGEIRPGDVVFLRLWVRALDFPPETGEARMVVNFQIGPPSFSKSLAQQIGFGREWRRFDFPFQVRHDDAGGGYRLALHLGFPPQVIEIGRVEVFNYRDRVAVEDLPTTRLTYPGREADAPWRAAAEARIREIRQGDVRLRVLDADGQAVSGHRLRIEQQRHHFGFGTAVAADHLVEQGADNDRYRSEVLRLFNTTVIENHLKWPFYETWGREAAHAAVEWLNRHELPVRGHVLVWPGFRNLPADLRDLADDHPALRRRIDTHIRYMTTTFRGKLYEWDAVNEPFDNHDLLDILGREEMVRWFRIARDGDPDALLYLNDYPQMDHSSIGIGHLGHFEETIAFLLEHGAPLDGIGFQGHIRSNGIPPASVLAVLDHFSRFGLPISITEYDMATQDEELQADHLRDFYTACFSHPSVNQIMMWGFWEGRHWRPEAALFRRDWSRKPILDRYEKLIFEHWWSRESGRSGADGGFTARLFHGDHRVTVYPEDGDRPLASSDFAVRPGEAETVVEIRLPH